MSQINLKHESGNAISLIEKQISELRKSSNQTNQHLFQILENAKRNEKLFLLSREIILGLLASSTIDDTVNELESYFISSFSTDACKVIFFSEDEERFGKERVTSPDLATDLFRDQFKDKDIIIYGESLGTAVAIDLASRYNFSGIILESPFTSMLDLAQKYYPIFPVKLILKDRYESRKKLNDIKSPVLVMHGKKDKIVPFYMGEQILEALSSPKFSYFNDNDDHMMEYNEDLLGSIKNFLVQVN